MTDIGKKCGFSREFIRQRLAANGIQRDDGGKFVQIFLDARDRIEKSKTKKNKFMDVWGCSQEFKNSLGGYKKGTPAFAFIRQRNSAIQTGKVWNLTLHEWWEIWQESGHWHERGRGKGKYVMARICDMGAYEVGNIKIITLEENSSEARDMDKIRGGNPKIKNAEYREIAKERGIPWRKCWVRIYQLGWTPEKALSLP